MNLIIGLLFWLNVFFSTVYSQENEIEDVIPINIYSNEQLNIIFLDSFGNLTSDKKNLDKGYHIHNLSSSGIQVKPERQGTMDVCSEYPVQYKLSASLPGVRWITFTDCRQFTGVAIKIKFSEFFFINP